MRPSVRSSKRALWVALFSWWCAAELAPRVAAQSRDDGVEVTLHDQRVFRVRSALEGQSTAQRAQRASRTLAEIAEAVTPEQVAVRDRGERCDVTIDRFNVIELSLEDARLAGEPSCAAHANAVAERVRSVLRREQQRSRVANTVFSASLVVFFGLVTVYLLRKLHDFSARSRRFLVENPQRVPALRLKRFEVLGPAAVRSVLLLVLSMGHGLGMLGLAYSWLVLSLSLFVGTRQYVERLTGFVLTPLSDLVGRLASALPLFVVVLIGVGLIAVIVRIAELFFASVARGETRLSWLDPELAQATSTLVRAGLVLFALVFAAPVLTGDPNGSLSRAGSIVLLALSLASIPLLTSLVAGISVTFSRTLRVGDRVEYGGRTGRVREVGVLVLTLEDDEGCMVRVPHALSLWHPTRVHSRAAP